LAEGRKSRNGVIELEARGVSMAGIERGRRD